MAPPLTRSPSFTWIAAEGIEQNIHARTELDEADPFAALHAVANFQVENDAAREQAGDLLEDHGTAFAFDGHDVLLVLFGGCGFMAFRNLPR